MRTIRTLVYLLIVYGLPFYITSLYWTSALNVWWKIILTSVHGIVSVGFILFVEMLLSTIIVKRYLTKVLGNQGTQDQFRLSMLSLTKFGISNHVPLMADSFFSLWWGLSENYDERVVKFYTNLFSLPEDELQPLLKKELFDKLDVNSILLQSGLKR